MNYFSKLKNNGYKIEEKNDFIFARRNILGKIGPDIIHIGILVTLISGLIIGLTTKTESFYLKIGDKFYPGGKEFILTDFKVYKYDDGSVKDWISVVSDGNNEYSIEVNKPLSVNNGKLYQWSHKLSWDVKLYFEGADYTFEGKELSEFKVGDYSVRISRFIPDLKVIDGKVYNNSDEPNNPAILIEYYNLLGVLEAKQWVFEKMDYPTSPPNFKIKAKLLGYKKNEMTGLLYSSSKGDTIMFIGLILIAFGSMISIKRDFNKIYIIKEENKFKLIYFDKKYLNEFGGDSIV